MNLRKRFNSSHKFDATKYYFLLICTGKIKKIPERSCKQYIRNSRQFGQRYCGKNDGNRNQKVSKQVVNGLHVKK